MDLDTSLTSFNVPFPLVMRTLESMSQVYQDLFLTMIPPQDSFLVKSGLRSADHLLPGRSVLRTGPLIQP